jgi:hypothetical protein
VNIVIQAHRRSTLVREDGNAENPANGLPTTNEMTNHPVYPTSLGGISRFVTTMILWK